VSAGGIVLSLPGGVSLTFTADTPAETVRAYMADAGMANSDPRRNNLSSPFMTVEEAAEFLRFPVKRIYNLTSKGEIPHRKQEGRLIFRRDELERWMDLFYLGPSWAGPQTQSDL
jgi:excisionase family DNA binding protein